MPLFKAWTVARALWMGTLLALAGIAACLLALPRGILSDTWEGYSTSGLFRDDYGRRWSGGCQGWTHSLVWWNVAGLVAMWWAYCCIAVVLRKLHPIPKWVPSARPMLAFTSIFFLGCGATHLANAYASFHPVYNFVMVLNLGTGAVSIIGAYLIARSLVAAFANIEIRHREADARMANLGQDRRD